MIRFFFVIIICFCCNLLYAKVDEGITPYPVIFMHGIGGGFHYWEKTIALIAPTPNSTIIKIRYFDTDSEPFHNYTGKKADYWFCNVSYYTQKPLEESLFGNIPTYAKRLKQVIEIVKALSGKDKVILIAHSMGGLVGRAYMVLDQSCWESVHKILTVGTPNEGVRLSVGIVGQLEDLRAGSSFITRLNKQWLAYQSTDSQKKWGVIGGVVKNVGNQIPDAFLTDEGGLGYIEIASAIPYGEYPKAFGNNFNQIIFNTPHFGLRGAIRANHDELLIHPKTLEAIQWAIRKD